MTSPVRAIVRDAFPTRLALFYGAAFAIHGIQLPFFPVWLKAKGLDAEAIGLVLAAPMLLRMVTVPLAARAADRRGALRAGLIATSLAGTMAYGVIGLAEGFLPILAAVALAGVFTTPLLPLLDAYALKGLALRGRAYGPVRLWGSVAFIAANFGAGALAGLIAPTGTIWLIVGGYGVAVMAAFGLRPLSPSAAAAASLPPARGRVLPSGRFLAVAVAASLVQASHAVYYGFSTLDWGAKGLGGSAIGALWALGVLAEIALFAVAGRLPAALGAGGLLAIGAGGAVVRWSAMALDPPLVLLPLLQCLHGLSFGAAYLGAVQYLAAAAPDGRAATVQGDFSTVQAIVMTAATGLSGVLYGSFGGLAYAAMALLAGAGGLIALTVRVAPSAP